MNNKKEMNYKKLCIGILYMLISFLILLRLFTKEYYNGTVDYIYTLLFLLPIIVITLINTYATNKYFLQKKYLTYSLVFILLSAIGIALHYLFFDHLAPFFLKDFYFISMPIIEIAQYIFAFLAITLLLTISLNWFELRDNQRKLEKEKNETQLNNLKAQLNPHFLFYSLNNIYSITGKENQEARSYILKLADALRYMLYKTQSNEVLLSDEIEYIENYIGLEKLRLESNANTSFIKKNLNPHTKIAPLLFLPLIENCFKHCNKSNPFIIIEISQKEKMLNILCKNNISDENFEDGGLGNVNLKKRLEILYPGKYELSYLVNGDIFESTLTLKLNNDGKL